VTATVAISRIAQHLLQVHIGLGLLGPSHAQNAHGTRVRLSRADESNFTISRSDPRRPVRGRMTGISLPSGTGIPLLVGRGAFQTIVAMLIECARSSPDQVEGDADQGGDDGDGEHGHHRLGEFAPQWRVPPAAVHGTAAGEPLRVHGKSSRVMTPRAAKAARSSAASRQSLAVSSSARLNTGWECADSNVPSSVTTASWRRSGRTQPSELSTAITVVMPEPPS
jgi:hypothetical protein